MPSVGHKPTSLDLDIYRGDYFAVALSEPTLGAFAPGDSFVAQIRAEAASNTVIETFNFDTSAIAAGTLVLYLTDSETAALTFTRAVWDLERTRAGRPLTMFAGAVSLTKDVSRP